MTYRSILEGPPTVRHPMRGVRTPPELEAKLDAWIEAQPESKPVLSVVEGPSRSEAIGRLLEMALKNVA
ncbi:MAG TPA: hypothetical protein VGW34_14355 [Allosphingosinicella sp.]|nr:hypothetical protein [Allosphingosinicella sp.]